MILLLIGAAPILMMLFFVAMEFLENRVLRPRGSPTSAGAAGIRPAQHETDEIGGAAMGALPGIDEDQAPVE